MSESRYTDAVGDVLSTIDSRHDGAPPPAAKQEMKEEAGLGKEKVISSSIIGLVYDPPLHTMDICFRIELSDIEGLEADEYSEIRSLPPENIQPLVTSEETVACSRLLSRLL